MTAAESVRDLLDGTDHDLDLCWEIGMCKPARYVPGIAQRKAAA